MGHSPVHLQPGSPSWPAALVGIEGPPEELWALGRTELLAGPACVAIVGSRGPTAYGREQAARFAAAFARQGWTVVSGLARGIDEEAHAAALEAGGATIAVLGCGVDRPWPAGRLADAVRDRGLLLSEYRPGTPPRRHHFPLRNRIISGLSSAVLVVEAARRSGSLITARWAADQGRAVFAVPGPVDSPLSGGTLQLIREGASPVGNPGELLAELTGQPDAPEPRDGPLPETALVRALRAGCRTADELARELRQPAPAVLVELVQAELDGIVRRAPGGLYRLLERP